MRRLPPLWCSMVILHVHPLCLKAREGLHRRRRRGALESSCRAAGRHPPHRRPEDPPLPVRLSSYGPVGHHPIDFVLVVNLLALSVQRRAGATANARSSRTNGMDGMRNLRRPLRVAAWPILLGVLALFARTLTAAAVFTLPQRPTTGVGVVLPAQASPALTPVPQQMVTNTLVPTNISSGQLVLTNGVFDISVGILTVPSGKRLVIEFVSAMALLEPTQLLLTVSVDGLQVLPQFNGNQIGGSSVFAASQPLRDVLVAGQTLVVTAGRSNNSGAGVIVVNVVGELEDAP